MKKPREAMIHYLGAVRETAGRHAAGRWVLFLCRKTGQMIRPKTVSCLVAGYTPINNLLAAGKEKQ